MKDIKRLHFYLDILLTDRLTAIQLKEKKGLKLTIN